MFISITTSQNTTSPDNIDRRIKTLSEGADIGKCCWFNIFATNAAKTAFKKGKLVAAICAAPAVLGNLGILKGKAATCSPGFEDQLLGARYVSAPTVTDSNVITARGAGAAFDFGFAIVDFLEGNRDLSNELRESMQCAL